MAQKPRAPSRALIAENGERLLVELQPECEQVAADLREHAERLLADHARWGSLSARVAGYLMAMNMSPAEKRAGRA